MANTNQNRNGMCLRFEFQLVNDKVVAKCSCGIFITNATYNRLKNHLIFGEHARTQTSLNLSRNVGISCKCGVSIFGHQGQLTRHIKSSVHRIGNFIPENVENTNARPIQYHAPENVENNFEYNDTQASNNRTINIPTFNNSQVQNNCQLLSSCDT